VAQVVTTEQSASILVFPKVIADGSRDTIIQITNTSNNMQYAHCFYVDGAPTTPGYPPGSLNEPLCTEIDFDIWLTRQQPTHWVVSTGRLYNPSDLACSGTTTTCVKGTSGSPAADCCDAGFDPGHVPPVAPDFTGELMCIAVDPSGGPAFANVLKGEATLEDVITVPGLFTAGDVSKYNAIGIQSGEYASEAAYTDVLCLGSNAATFDPTLCPYGKEYAGCPVEWRFDHPATGAPDPVVQQQTFCPSTCACPDGGPDTCKCNCSSVSTNLTVVPCTQNFETQALTAVTLRFEVLNEFEQAFTTSTSFACWGSFDLGAPSGSLLPGISPWFTASVLGSDTLQTRISSATGTPGGVLAVIEETHEDTVNSLTARSAQNGDMIGELNVADLVTIPPEQGAVNQ
jgi:hypothetical protein